VTDAVLVRAPIGVTYRTLTDLDAWPRWLAGCRSRRLEVALAGEADVGAADHHDVVLPGPGRPLRLRIVTSAWRHDAGMRWDVRWRGLRPGGVRAEWWLEECREGAIVHHVLHDVGDDPHPRDVRAALRYRRSVNAAVQALKDHLELAVAHAGGRVP
jgi:hypothetical protein